MFRGLMVRSAFIFVFWSLLTPPDARANCALTLFFEAGVQVQLTHSPSPQIAIVDDANEQPGPNLSVLQRATAVVSLVGVHSQRAHAHEAQQRLKADPTSMDRHREVALSLQKYLWWMGIKTTVERSPEGHPPGYRVRIENRRAFSPGLLDWYVDLSRVLSMSRTSLEFDTSAFVEHRSTFLKIPGYDRRWLTLGGHPQLPGSIESLTAHELFHWVQDELRRRGNSETAWPAHYILRREMGTAPARLPFLTLRGPMRGVTEDQFVNFYRQSRGFMIEEIGSHGFQLALEYKILSRFFSDQNGVLAPPQYFPFLLQANPGSIERFRSTSILLDQSNHFAEQAYPCYVEALAQMTGEKSNLSIEVAAQNLLEIALPSGNKIYIETQSDPYEALAEYQAYPEKLRRELNGARERIEKEIFIINRNLFPMMQRLHGPFFQFLTAATNNMELEFTSASGRPVRAKDFANFYSGERR